MLITILILAFLFVISYYLMRRTKKVVNTTTTIDTTTPTPEPTLNYWYILNRCDDSKTYYAGPFTGKQEYSTGAKVEGSTNVFYVVIGTTNSSPESVISGITSTGVFGC